MNVTITNPNFRPGSTTDMKEFVFSMMMPKEKTAALGDMISWLPAIKYVAEAYNYVKGHLLVPDYFAEIARNVMSEYPHWRVHTKLPDRLAKGALLKQPLQHPINATGMHLTDLGFLYFVGIVPPPEGSRAYPLLNLEDVELRGEFESIGAFAVLTPVATTSTRAMLPSQFNAVTKHLLSKEITPVFLGNYAMKDRQFLPFNDAYDLSVGVNLIGKTSLLEAAKIMEASRLVLGIDNGLLHLAAMTDVTILYGYTMAGPEQRRIERTHGHTIEVYGDKEKLPCLFCQERVRFFVDHHFTNCLYKEREPMCVKMLTPETWCASIDMALAEGN